MRVLVSFVGAHDPVSSSPPIGAEIDGPVLTLAKHRSFDRVVLLATGAMAQRAADTRDMLRARMPSLDVGIHPFDLADPTDHLEILRRLRALLPGEVHRGECFAAIASGTPQMHACWLLLAASGQYPLKLLQLRPPRFVSTEQPLITVLDPLHPEFPRVVADLDRLAAPKEALGDRERFRQATGIVGDHPLLHKALTDADRAGRAGVSVLILGETGTGKELMARFIHACSGRTGAFVALNCGGLPEHLAESELFGHRKGAFTGADKDRAGLFIKARGGTLFLDEIGDMPPALQVKLLRVLNDRKIRPVGADEEQPVDVLLLAATNVDIQQALQEKTLREDLYYRVAGMEITLPPLRQRCSDIPALVAALMAQSNLAREKRFTGNALRKLQQHAWPGNIRELAQAVNQALVLCEGPVIDAPDIVFRGVGENPDEFAWLPDPHEGFSLDAYCSAIRRRLKDRALQLADNQKKRAAQLLGISAAALSKKKSSPSRERNE